MIPIAIILAIVLSGAVGISLMCRQTAAVAAHREHVPDGFAGWISAEEHWRAAAYTLARTRLAIAETVFDTVLAVLWLLVLLGPLYALVARFVAPGISRDVAVVVAFALVGRVLYLPFSIYSTFALEARFGFNRATPAMFLHDRIKGVALSALLGVPLLYGLFWLLRVMPDTWWLRTER
jgi:STE24 endopeptidase